MKCPKCQNDIPDSSKQCPVCGKLIISIDEYEDTLKQGSSIDDKTPLINKKYSIDLMDKDIPEQVSDNQEIEQEQEEQNPLDKGIFVNIDQNNTPYDENELTGVAEFWQNLCKNLHKVLKHLINLLLYKLPFIEDTNDVLDTFFLMFYAFVNLIIYSIKAIYVLKDVGAIFGFISYLLVAIGVNATVIEVSAYNSNFKDEYSDIKSNDITMNWKMLITTCTFQQLLRIPLTIVSINSSRIMYIVNLVLSPIFLPLASCTVMYEYFKGKDFFSYSKAIFFFNTVIYLLIFVAVLKLSNLNPTTIEFFQYLRTNDSDTPENIGKLILYYGFLT